MHQIKLLLIFVLGITFFAEKSFAQNNISKTSSEYAKAKEDFLNGRYQVALATFELHLEKYPRDPEYQYYTGVCQVELQKNLDNAITNLRFAAIRDVPNNVYFYLGKALQINYQYDEAISYYSRFLDLSKKTAINDYAILAHIDQCKNAMNKSISYGDIEILSKEKVLLKNIGTVLNPQLQNGELFWGPSSFEYQTEGENNILTFLPKLPEKAMPYVISSIENEKTKTDLFLTKLLPENEELNSSPTKIENLSSDFDEGFCYFDYKNNVLYFSSNNKYSLGGYDIFTSNYNSINNAFEPPKSLCTPINSSADDYMYIVENDYAWLITNRSISPDSAWILKIKHPVNQIRKVEKSESLFDLTNIINTDTDINETSNVQIDENSAENTDYQSINIEINNSEVFSSPKEKYYVENIRKAMTLQWTADSMIRVANYKRKLLRERDPNINRNEYFKDVKMLEATAKSLHIKADDIFKNSRQYELELIKDINDKRAKIRYAEALTDPTLPEPEVLEKINSFEILSSTPYSDNNPVPLEFGIKEGVLYMIQLGAFSKEITWDKFGGLSPITGEPLPDRGITKFYVGIFSEIEFARKSLIEVRNYGYKDAYIVSFLNGKKIPVERAIEIENEGIY